jgi:hypothetical protein
MKIGLVDQAGDVRRAGQCGDAELRAGMTLRPSSHRAVGDDPAGVGMVRRDDHQRVPVGSGGLTLQSRSESVQ